MPVFQYQNITKQQGFTLIEVMLVIVIMAIMASLIVMNISGMEQRRVIQAREMLVLDLQRIRMEALDQGRTLGLVILPATDVTTAEYQVVEYKQQPINSSAQTAVMTQQNQYTQNNVLIWQKAQDFKTKALPEQSHLTIQLLDNQQNLDALKQVDNQNLPQLIWFGNGESQAARLQLYLQQQPVGDAIELNRIGAIVEQDRP